MVDTPKVSIIIPVKPGGEVSAIQGVGGVDYPPECLEVLVAEGNRPGRQRNEAVAASSGEILYFLDDDSMVSPDFLRKAVRHFQAPEVAAVGGPSLTPDTDGTLQHVFSALFSSPLSGAMRNRYRCSGIVRETSDRELILCNLGFRRETFLTHMGFDERLYPNEENELLERIKADGGRLIHDPGISVRRSQRGSVKAFCRQLFGYGRGRGEQTAISRVVRPATLVPSIFLLYLILLPLADEPIYYIPLLCYLVTIMAVAALEWLKGGRTLAAMLMPFLFPVYHLCYGAGVIYGICGRRWKAPPCNVEVTIRRVKEFGREWETK